MCTCERRADVAPGPRAAADPRHGPRAAGGSGAPPARRRRAPEHVAPAGPERRHRGVDRVVRPRRRGAPLAVLGTPPPRVALVGGLGVANVVGGWGHPEDCVAVALVVWAALTMERNGPAGCARARPPARARHRVPPLALLGVAPVLARLTWRAAARLSWRLVLPSLVVLGHGVKRHAKQTRGRQHHAQKRHAAADVAASSSSLRWAVYVLRQGEEVIRQEGRIGFADTLPDRRRNAPRVPAVSRK